MPHNPLQALSPTSWWVLSLVVTLLLALSACGDESPSTDDPAAAKSPSSPAGPEGDFPVTVRSGEAGGDDRITVKAEPQSIISLSPTVTEMLWAIGADEQVIAVDDQSDYPPGVPTTELSGFEPNVEAILNYEPDLVVASGDSGDLVSSLAAVSVPVLLLPSASDLEESYSQIERLGVATGHIAEAATLVAEMQKGIQAALAQAPEAQGLTYFHELSPSFYTATGRTFIGEIYSLFGLSSIANAAGQADAYPQLSNEYVVAADPDFVFIADNECCGVTVDKVRERAGWGQIAAIRENRVYQVDEDITSRWGPRVVEFVELVGDILTTQQASQLTR